MSPWVKRLASWLREARLFWIGLLVLAAGISFAIFLDLPEPYIRFTGLVLQLMGLYTVLHGISHTRRLFGLPSVTDAALSWLRRFPRPGQTGGQAHMVGLAAEVNAAGRIRARLSVAPGAELEARVRVLESNFRSLDQEVESLHDQMEQATSSSKQAMDAERQARQREVGLVSEKLALAETGGLTVSLVGLIWLMGGLIITSASYELAAWR